MGLTFPSYSVFLYLYWTYRPIVYIFPLYAIYIDISLQYIYLFLMQHACKTLKTTVFGMIHSQKLVVVFLHKHFTSRHNTVFNSNNIIMNCGAHSSAVCSDCATSQSQFRFQMVSLKFFTDLI